MIFFLFTVRGFASCLFFGQIYALVLIYAAFIYVNFSSWSENITWILIEITGVIVFSIIAFIGIKYSP